VNNATSNPDSTGKRRKWLRTVGVLILLLGLGAAGIVYWTGSPPEDLSADPSTARSYKTESRDIEVNFGKMGLLMNDLQNDLKYPGTQALIIITASILAASGCFLFAHWLDGGGEHDDPVA
jgi:flagellar basal body-associated protein FliL